MTQKPKRVGQLANVGAKVRNKNETAKLFGNFLLFKTFLLGLKGEIRNNVLAAERLLVTSTPVSQWRGILQIFGYKSLGESDEQTGGFFGGHPALLMLSVYL